MLGRSIATMRRWANDGRAPTGERLHVARDPVTHERMFPRADIERVAASLRPISAA